MPSSIPPPLTASASGKNNDSEWLRFCWSAFQTRSGLPNDRKYCTAVLASTVFPTRGRPPTGHRKGGRLLAGILPAGIGSVLPTNVRRCPRDQAYVIRLGLK